MAAAYLFGSVARGSAGPESDVDIGIVYSDSRARAQHPRVAAELSVEIGKALACDLIDLVDLEAQGSIFCHQVLCEGRRLYESERDRRIDFESGVIIRALDFRPTYELATRGKPAALRRWLRQRPA